MIKKLPKRSPHKRRKKVLLYCPFVTNVLSVPTIQFTAAPSVFSI